MANHNFYRAALIAHRILEIVARDRPDDIAELRDRFWVAMSADMADPARHRDGRIQLNATSAVVRDWCADLGLPSPAVQLAAWDFAEGRVHAPDYSNAGVDDEDWPRYDLPVVLGETKQDFLVRAAEAYEKMHYKDPTHFVPQRVEWLVRHCVGGVGFKALAAEANLSRQRVREIVRDLAAILDLDLRSDGDLDD